MRRTDYLFSNFDWFSVQDHQSRMLNEAVSQMGSGIVLNTPLDDICDELRGRFEIVVPTLDKEAAHVNQREIDMDISSDRHRHFVTPGPHYVKATEIALSIPFTGNPDYFRVKPTQFTSCPPTAEINGSCLVLKVVGEKLEPQTVKLNLDKRITEIETYLATLRGDTASFNQGIEARVRPQLEARKKKLLADQNLVSELGFPLRPRTNQPSTFAAPSVRRKLKPGQAVIASSATYKPEPTLLSDDYDHILKVLEGMAIVMERSPSAFKNLDEEALRTHFLVQLNGHYEGQATGETFNYEGKTDILVRSEGRNIFIAECKYWDGPKKLLETIDQVLGYSSWRDTKVAIIISTGTKASRQSLMQ